MDDDHQPEVLLPAPSSDDATVGPGRPPKATRWKKGGPSPNPKGRPRKDSMFADVKRLFEDALKQKVPLTRNGRRVYLAKVELGFEQLANQFAKGDRHARRDVFTYSEQLGIDLTGKAEALKETLTPNHQEILDAYLARQRSSDDRLKDERVIAPVDLLDNDADEVR
ncbi:hypothetical protein GGQ85_003850 [Nitrobacter vulgaris]|uniref:DUF5681 domain-containing protein n=1 Tax=Nitrobacter vulgaris TaxID=29421 RepID=UPI00285F56D6|nr:DUF5681 domain-containing protein [Nitrobacter vulgaris]MDR6306122.1 hypothetical protein [Nitrobacter vulgaris]